MATQRKIGATDSETRSKLLDAAERLMLEEGYAAVTSRHVGRTAGISPQLVHYYFRTMDHLFLEVFRRRAEEGIALFEQAMERERSLRSIWEFRSGTVGAAYNLEFAALANHRKVIRAEIARYAVRFRDLQLEAVTAVLAEQGGPTASISPKVLLLTMTGVVQVLALEEGLGLTDGHDEMLAFIDDHLDGLDAM
jgi:AcrR family transcriptional regulator